jgi:uncharacterized protein (DUF1015 family)
MAEIFPFRGVRYNQGAVGDLAAVICPPYDVISGDFQKEIYQRSPYNFVRIEYGQELPQDSASDNKYVRAARWLHEWLENGILVTESKPAIYLHDQYFIFQGREMKRRGITVRVRLEEWAKMVVRPHEGTLSGPKSDRISLLGAIHANTSPVFSMYEDDNGVIAATLQDAVSKTPPDAMVDWHDGERHELWAISDNQVINTVVGALKDKPLYIADGHHRYESALIYQRERRMLHPDDPEDAPYNFVMMTLVAFNDPGMLILPPHRLIRGRPASELVALSEKLPLFFDIKSVPLDKPDVWREVDKELYAAGKLRLAVFGLDSRNIWILTLRDFEVAGRLMPCFHTDIYKKLDVSIVDHIILKDMMGIPPDDENGIAFNYDREDAVNKVEQNEFQMVFIVKPVKPETIKSIADAGDRMPRKSTYFYPKLPSGLVINHLV